MAASFELRLHVVSGVMEGLVAEFPVKKKVTIGRTRVNAFHIKHDTVSQRHAFVIHKDGQWIVTDSNSSNGTFINGVAVAPGVPAELKDGDRLGIGPEIEVSVKINNTEGNGGQAVELEEGRRKQEPSSSSQGLTVKEWFMRERQRIGEEHQARTEASVRQLVERAEAVKRSICEAVGLEYTSISNMTDR